MEDLVSANDDHMPTGAGENAPIGLAQGIQCLGGEIPFFFWSGWVNRKMRYDGNCMALVLAVMAVRMICTQYTLNSHLESSLDYCSN
ncbi:unnamed protein product [Macrosiphum euphorbiae]|uniref:Uncharacterized protein n=1 Tax=Macrosiphum euphorbiae TaxID=13131 RepID=A0AAV0XQ20_9HEMI|nr:unnamed protein product [Macrosiphum euphorbiae]